MSDFDLPARRELPSEVRARIRARALPGRQPRRSRFSHGRAPFAVAAGVAVLAAGAMIVSQSIVGGPGTPGQRTNPPTASTTPQALNVRQANAELDRCWAAIQAEGKADRYPDRTRWRAVSSTAHFGLMITAAFVGDNKPIFCQTTQTTVRVSEPTGTPAYAPGSRTAALFISPEGVIAGLQDPSWPGLSVWLGDGNVSDGWRANHLSYGLFLVTSLRYRIWDNTKIEVDRWDDVNHGESSERLALPRPAALVSRVDRPTPQKDRISERGQWLKQCLDKSQSPLIDPDMWEPGAIVDVKGSRYMVVRAGREFAYCFNDATHWGFGISVIGVPDFGKDKPHMLPGPDFLIETTGDAPYVTGALPDAVAKVEIVQANHPVITADVWNDTYAAQLLDPPDRVSLVRGYDATGKKLYEGTLY